MFLYFVHIFLFSLFFVVWLLLAFICFILLYYSRGKRAMRFSGWKVAGLFLISTVCLWRIDLEGWALVAFCLLGLLFHVFAFSLSLRLFVRSAYYRLVKYKMTRSFMSDFLHYMYARDVASQERKGKVPFVFYSPAEELRLEQVTQSLLHNSSLNLKLLARELSTNETYLSRYFNRQRGVAFPEYVRLCRLYEAEQLLLQTDATIVDISEQVGFQTLSNFYQVFNEHHRMSPAQWRKSIKRDCSISPLRISVLDGDGAMCSNCVASLND